MCSFSSCVLRLQLHAGALTDAVPLVPGQLKPWTTLTGHTPFGCFLADVGAAVLLIHTVEALWDRKREKVHNETPAVTD